MSLFNILFIICIVLCLICIFLGIRYYQIIKNNKDLLKNNEELKNKVSDWTNHKYTNFFDNIEKIALLRLLVKSKTYNGTFIKSRIDENYNGDNNKFYLYKFIIQGDSDSKVYKWKLDMKYWDLFECNIGTLSDEISCSDPRLLMQDR